MSNVYAVYVQKVIDHRVYVEADSEEEAENKVLNLEGTEHEEKLFDGACCTNELLVAEVWDSSESEYLNDAHDIMFIGSDGIPKTKSDYTN